MTDFQIVKMPDNGELLTLDHFVGDTRITRIDFEADGLQILDKVLAAKKSSLHDAAESI